MPSCTICRFQVVDDSATVCPNCGAPLPHRDEAVDRIEQASPFSGSGTDTASPDSAPRPSVMPSASGGDDDSLEICDPGEFLGAAKSSDETTDPSENREADKNDLIGQSAPGMDTGGETASAENPAPNPPKPAGIQKLSDEQINNIRSSMMHEESESEFATPEDASLLLHNLRKTGEAQPGPSLERQNDIPPPPPESAPESVSETQQTYIPEPPQPPEPKPDLPRPVKTTPIRNVAYFHKNFIQLTGTVHPVAGEEIRIDDRAYVLRPKRIKPQYAITAFAILAAIFLFIIGKQFISPTVPGTGSVVGLILDDSGRPLSDGLQLRIPEIGKTVVSNAAGFFRFDGIATGTYVIEFTLPDGRVGTENVSVAADELTTVSMSTADATVRSVAEVSSSPTRQHSSRSAASESPTAPAMNRNRETVESGSTASAQKEYSDLKFRANVDNARLIVNGQALGNGNMTYRKLMPGTHSPLLV